MARSRLGWHIAIVMVLAAPCLGQATAPGPASPPLKQIPAPVPPAPYVPFPGLPTADLDEANNGIGVAQAVAREAGLQGRVLWVDAVANLARINSAEKIQALVKQIAAGGFNTIVLEVKPIVGMTLYPSKIAPRLDAWNGVKLPSTLDPLAEFLKVGRAAGIGVVASLNVFSEGHRSVSKGPAWSRPDWQTVVCEPRLVLVDPATQEKLLVSLVLNSRAETTEELTAYTNPAAMETTPDAAIAVVDAACKVATLTDGERVPPGGLAIPKGGAALVGEGDAGDFLRRVAAPGAVLALQTTTRFVPILESRIPGTPVWVNPHHMGVQQRMLAIVSELVTRYPVDGVVFDDRLRFAAITADFSPATRAAFEEYVGKPLRWPDDVLRLSIGFPAMNVRVLPGPQMDAWLVWRALAVRNWVARAAAVVKAARPKATLGVYVGSWYGEYPAYGANWAADDFQAGFRFLTDAFRQTGFAGLVDWITPGCYYQTATVAEATGAGTSVGYTVEAAGQLANRAANSQAWVYAGLSLERFAGNPDGLARALQAACASTQGVMVFDLSHKIDPFWPVFKRAFARPARAPHTVPGLLAQVRAQQAERRAAGIQEPAVVIQNGQAGAGL